MSRTCESCGRSWRGSASFCGACGDLLPDAMAATTVRSPSTGSARRGPVLAVALGVVVLAAAAAVPSLTIERTPPVTGEVGVPETDELQAAPAGTTIRRAVPGPEVSCSRDGETFDCVVWERDLGGPPDPQGEQLWPTASGDHILLVGPDGIEGIDARTGTRRWRVEEQTHHPFPRGVGETVVAIEGQPDDELRVIDLATGDVRWRASGFHGTVQGELVHGDLVLTGSDGGDPAVVARDLDDGTERWRWSNPWPWVQATSVREDRLVLSPASDDDGLAIVDPRTGTEIATSTARVSWWIRGAVDDTIVLAEPLEPDASSGGDLAGDGGAVLRGVSLEDGTVRWERRVRAGHVQFGMAAGVVLAPSTGRILAIEVSTGEVAWQAAVDAVHELAYHGPAGFDGSPDWSRLPPVVVTVDRSAGLLRALDATTGAPQWDRPIDGAIQHVAVSPDVVWVGLDDGFLILDPATGRERVRVHGTQQQVQPFSLEPLLLFHHESGTVLRLDPDAETDR